MTGRRDNLVILIGSLVVFLFLGTVGFMLPSFQGATAALQIKASLLLAFGFLIIPIWLSAGAVAGIIFFVLSIFIAALLVINSDEPALAYFAFLNLFLICVLVFFSKKTHTEEYLKEIEIEKIEEEQNYLQAELRKTKDTTLSLQEKIERYSHLNMVCDVLSSSLELETIVDLITAKSLEMLGKGDRDLLYLVNEKNRRLSLAKSQETEPGKEKHIKSKRGDAYDQWTLKRKLPLIITDTRKDFRFSTEEAEKGRSFRSLISVPLWTQQKTLGLLRVESEKRECFTPDDLRLLDVIGHLSSVAIDNAVLYKKTEELAIHDDLTGLYVHKYFHQRLQEEIHRAMLSNSFLSLFMCDLDHFKTYNDKYGHQAGDILLKGVASVLIKNTLETDLAARYGGEEFAVILLHRQKEEARKIAETVRTSIQNKVFRLRREETHITISIGLVTFPTDGMLKQGLIKKADEALYRAKEKGRNRVEVC